MDRDFNKMKKLIAGFLLIVSFAVCAGDKNDGALIQPDDYYPRIKLETSAGDIIVELDRTRSPITVNNFLVYVTNGSYNGTIFHRVEKDFVIQGGGYNDKLEERPSNKPIFNESGNGLKNEKYTIAMARLDNPHSAKRQFYFNMADNDGLDPGKEWGYTVFGYVTEGESVLDFINGAPTHIESTYDWENVPVRPIFLTKATLLKPE